MNLKDTELAMITGGAISLSSSLLNSISKIVTTLFDLGRNVGSAIRYAIGGKTCKL